MGGHWKLVNFDNEIINSRESHDKNWGANSPKSEESMEMIDMLTCIQNHVSSSAEGEVITINDKTILKKQQTKNGGKPAIMKMMLVEQ